MKTLNNYINEKFQITKDSKIIYAYYPETKQKLIECIKEKIDKEGLGTKNNPLDLNDIDTSKITDMSNLFDAYGGDLINLSVKGNFDISKWDVSNVTNMQQMFWKSNFNGDISNWDVSNVEDMYGMFYKTKFDGDISDWDVSKVKTMEIMFHSSKFSGKNGNISDWNVSNVENMFAMFVYCPLDKNPPKWYKE